MSAGLTVVISIAILCITLVGIYAVAEWHDVENKQIELALKVLEEEERKYNAKLN